MWKSDHFIRRRGTNAQTKELNLSNKMEKSNDNAIKIKLMISS